jgi:hypothetical protein
VWRKPPALDSFDAPILYRVGALGKFRRARVTVGAEWKTLFDQVIGFPEMFSTVEGLRCGVRGGWEFMFVRNNDGFMDDECVSFLFETCLEFHVHERYKVLTE